MTGRLTVGIAALSLLDPQSRRVVSHQRWNHAVELTRLLVDMGYDVAWWQVGTGWAAEVIPGTPLYGLLRGETQVLTHPLACDDFYEKANGVDWALYFDAVLAYPQVHERSISLAQGVSWDDPLRESRLSTADEREEWRRRMWMALRAPLKVVTADTAVIQWAMATWPGFYHQFVHIPGFVPSLGSIEDSTPAGERDTRETGTMRLLFPGPLTPAAGISETVRAMDVLLARHEGLEFHLTGSGTAEVEAFLAQWAEGRPRVRFHPRALTPALLETVDLVLFPVKGWEEVSMACLQALAAGRVVLAGPAAGLTDLVIHDHNGIIVHPTAAHLVRAVEDLLADPGRCRRLGERARDTAAAFSLEIWRQRWQTLIQQVIG